MSQKETQRKLDTLIDEENDFYLSFINKKLRNVRKKLADIDELSKRESNSLKPEQLEKIKSRPDVVQNIKYFEDLKDIYYTAYKAAGKDVKQIQKESSAEKPSQSGSDATNVEDGNLKQEDITVQETMKEEIIKDTIKKLLNLASISQIFGNLTAKAELLKTNDVKNNVAGLDSIQELYKLAFDFNDRSKSLKVEDQVKNAVDRLTLFVKAEDQLAVGDKTYKIVQNDVETIASLASFKGFDLNVQENIETQVNELSREIQNEESAHLLTTAAVLKPDLDDFVKSPEKERTLPKEPKAVRFVDEIERDMQNVNAKQNMQDTSSRSSNEEVQVAKVSREPVANDEGEEAQEQKSFRKSRNHNGYHQNRTRNDEYNSNGTQSNKGFKNNQTNHRRYGNEGSRNYGRNTYDSESSYQGKGNGSKFQYREYVQKRPSGDQV